MTAFLVPGFHIHDRGESFFFLAFLQNEGAQHAVNTNQLLRSADREGLAVDIARQGPGTGREWVAGARNLSALRLLFLCFPHCSLDVFYRLTELFQPRAASFSTVFRLQCSCQGIFRICF